MTSRDRRYAFVVGTGRCGSSVLHEILAHHGDVGFVSNLDDLVPRVGRSTARWNGPLHRALPAAATTKGRLRFAPSEAYRLLAREVSPLVVEPVRDLVAADATPWLADRLRQAFDARAGRQPGGLFLHKFTGWPRARFLAAVFPEARFVHVVRDGREVATSWLRMPWWRGHLGPTGWHFGPLPAAYQREWEVGGRSFALLAGLGWKLLLDAFEDSRAEIDGASGVGGRWLDVRYEDLLDRPQATMAEILDFLGLAADHRVSRTLDQRALRPPNGLRFRHELAPSDVAQLDQSLADHLARFGYPPSRQLAS